MKKEAGEEVSKSSLSMLSTMDEADTPKVPLNDYFLKLQQRRQDNQTTADFLKLMDFVDTQKQMTISNAKTSCAYRKKPVDHTKELYAKGNFIPV